MSEQNGKTRKTLGVTELHWACPFCTGVNKGTDKVCTNCGAAQPKDVAFFQPAQEQLITDEAKVAQAKAAAPDVHCAYCGTRNRADATVCVRCGADLAEGAARAAGGVLGAHQDKAQPDVLCPACGNPNPATARKCAHCFAPLPAARAAAPAAAPAPVTTPTRSGGGSRVLLFIGLGILALIVFFVFMATRTTETVATVQTVEWTRTIAIMGLVPVERDDWVDELPQGADDVRCEERVRTTATQPDPQRRSVEVCGTPYTVDLGTGLGEVVQDCEYQIYDSFCRYDVLEMGVIDTLRLTGNDFNARWPTIARLESGQEEGQRNEQYEIVFRSDGQNYTYTTRDFNEFQAFQQAERWILNVNGFGGVTSVEPAR